VTKRDQEVYEVHVRRALKGTISRAQLLAAFGAGVALVVVPDAPYTADAAGTGRAPFMEFPFFPQVKGTYTSESILDILNVLETIEMFLLTTNTSALTSLGAQLKEPILSERQAKSVIGQYHLDYLEALGARPLLTTFTPRNKPTPSSAIGGDAELVIGAYMTAVREFAELGQPLLAKNAFQAGATWADIRGVSRALGRTTDSSTTPLPALNKAFETDHWVYTRDYYKFYVEGTQFENSGVSRSGLRLTYPGRDAVLAAAGPMASAVIQKTPNNAIVSTNGAAVAARGEAAALTGERGDTP
jgi:hypothetical protein